MLVVAHAWKGWVGSTSAMSLQTSQAIFQASSIGKGQWLRNLDDENVRDKFQATVFSAVELVAGARNAAKNLNAWASGMLKETQERKTDTDGDADAEVPEEGC